jgi:hypothetical protein
MKKVRVIVARVSDYEVELDDPELEKNWEEHAKKIAISKSSIGNYPILEDYGIVKVNGKFPFTRDPNALINHSINIKIAIENNPIEISVEEVV